MLKKIDKTRMEAEKVRKIKDSNNERLQLKIKVIEEEQIKLYQKRDSILTGKQAQREKLVHQHMKKHMSAAKNAQIIRKLS